MKAALLLNVSTIGILFSLAPSVTAEPTARVKDIAFVDLAQPSHRLTTQSRSSDAMWLAAVPSIDHVNQVGETIPTAADLVPTPVNPIDALSDFSGTLDRFLAQEPPQPEPFKPLAFFEIPSLESGLTVGLLNF